MVHTGEKLEHLLTSAYIVHLPTIGRHFHFVIAFELLNDQHISSHRMCLQQAKLPKANREMSVECKAEINKATIFNFCSKMFSAKIKIEN